MNRNQSYNCIGKTYNQAYIFHFKTSGNELNKEIKHQQINNIPEVETNSVDANAAPFLP